MNITINGNSPYNYRVPKKTSVKKISGSISNAFQSSWSKSVSYLKLFYLNKKLSSLLPWVGHAIFEEAKKFFSEFVTNNQD